jgi:hypothetical protein
MKKQYLTACARLLVPPRGRFDMIHLQPIILLCGSSSIMLFQNATRLRHLKGVPRDFGLLFVTDAIPVARDMLIAKQRPNLF